MTTKADFSEEEWDELVNAPITAGVLIITADPHVTSIMGEMSGMMKGMMNQEIPAGAEELVGALIEEIKIRSQNKEKMDKPELDGKDPEEVVGEMLGKMSSVAALVDVKCSAEEAEGYKQWLMGVAQATAEAGREGGFLGIGSVRVSDKEKAALEKIAHELGLS